MSTPAPDDAGVSTTPAPDDGATTTEHGRGGPTTARRNAVVGRLSAWLDALPLRTRLVGITAALLAVGLGATGVVTQAYVSHSLVQQVDDQLRRTAGNEATLNQTIRAATSGPGEYYMLMRWVSGDARTIAWQPTVSLYGSPQIPQFTTDDVADLDGQPFTVTSSGGTHPTQWRVVAVNVRDRLTVPMRDGVAFIALPLSSVHDASRTLARTLTLAGIGIILLGGGAAWLLVRRSLRPLQEIETTAAAIAAGDYARRVPAVAAPTTEVGSLGLSLNAMLAQIEAAFAAREESERRMRRFISDASHELRTPLATIRGYGELYRMGALDTPDKVDDTMGRVEDAARRMGLLVNDLLVLARLDEGRPLRTDRVDLVAMADDAAQDLVALDPTRTVRVVGLEADAPPSALVVTGDGDRLRQVLTNLVGNVARHTPAGSPAELALGTVVDHADATRAAAVVEVRDHGHGVPPEQATRLFERFFRADTSRTRESGGSGLGLAIVAAIVGAHGGHVSTRSPQGGGLVVRVELPLAGAASSPRQPERLQ
ncbi:histidine kinase [Xylanimonas cellulosilytica DSM 15894]|uniref:histidine kinase n=1 Tax=Xylanimonas cellulosilytica (strain DSM 15894 / JCM 12276 / CECT 5975 / KCTC 9989 / LMG 20990 / NBRC 107835 / XIL07) TaxID=446471 RepID=D1BZ48_XYLCX|nr:HAMP domain-containing sensor histidine kinase [Xylanimonas cellulosilytica]ACZ31945.1 histidine kinase [Xylanimonas cellulosilytica DSM 15894]